MYEHNFRISYSQAGALGRLKLTGAMNLCQDIADDHAERVGVSVADLLKQSKTWVLHRFKMTIQTMPQRGDLVTIKTWYRPEKNLYSLRNFEMLDCNGKKLLSVQTSWVVVDMNRGRPLRLDRVMPEAYDKNKDENLEVSFQELLLPEKVDVKKTIQVAVTDLDMNFHVNNVHYLRWALDTIPVEILKEYKPKGVEIAFKRPAFYGDSVISEVGIDKNSCSILCRHHIYGEKDGQSMAVISTEWEKISREER
ncbi:acyl-ACP thioesterase [Thermovirga lienii DSM 17291]|uniref:Acyl-ACP thioesterase n=1 Tax=Thermovirga lienii (strain ATCC BAA-1197 / DSM 17291 / Cas60314) TaxID=580340 RepID=G7V8P3_THELD|nr:acyl-ACP thioesterase domain-containing protein [Thermovirga lienii]AER67504.1 acyl-ACP thioesterase [Thermovirga lienii DSM 17291]MDN5319280.1 hypothetical protein [Thermovirga sp.]